jgi:hypothetical protein
MNRFLSSFQGTRSLDLEHDPAHVHRVKGAAKAVSGNGEEQRVPTPV